MTKNSVSVSHSYEWHKMIKSSEMGYVLEIKSVTPEDADDYREDCGGILERPTPRLFTLQLSYLVVKSYRKYFDKLPFVIKYNNILTIILAKLSFVIIVYLCVC